MDPAKWAVFGPLSWALCLEPAVLSPLSWAPFPETPVLSSLSLAPCLKPSVLSPLSWAPFPESPVLSPLSWTPCLEPPFLNLLSWAPCLASCASSDHAPQSAFLEMFEISLQCLGLAGTSSAVLENYHKLGLRLAWNQVLISLLEEFCNSLSYNGIDQMAEESLGLVPMGTCWSLWPALVLWQHPRE